MAHAVQTRINRSDLYLPLDALTTTEDIWLEFGWATDNPKTTNMLWYNEGRASEIGYWTRRLCQKVMTNEPKGEMYFTMRYRETEHRIIVG